MAQHHVSPATVARAVARLSAEGVLATETGRGTFVRRREMRDAPIDAAWQTVALGEPRADASAILTLLAPPGPDTIVLSGGYPAEELQPLAALTSAAARAARRPGAWSLPPAYGLPELRELLAAHASADPGQVLVVPGGQAGVSAALRGLAAPGSAVLVEVPTYLGALAAMRGAGLRAVPVPSDEKGLRSDLLPAVFESTGSRLLYLQPTYANPTGAVLDRGRRADVLTAARRAGAFIIEDDWARDLALDGPPPPPLLADDEHGHVVYLSSLSKSAAPSLRIGALIARGPAAERLAAVRLLDDFGVARPLQETAVELLSSAAWPRHLARLRAVLRRRRDHLVQELRKQLPQLQPVIPPNGGLHLWQRLPEGMDDVDLVARARSEGLLIGAGRPYFVSEPPGSFVRLTYAQSAEDKLTAGVTVFADLISRYRGV